MTMHSIMNIITTFFVAFFVISLIVLVNHATKEDRMKGLKNKA